ncbi:hypothetical protein FA13DRAFT_2418 [Coprinellus micaceus]|uniref:Arrestin C-terminal-like domain-containing protein n=1 Tax=Coprinellus micaceus TaxID=71717 RepID=A0A4Y7TZ59_COPMI|nr:hypothetical protein FA13DRAFT_2418 [Coprinellus micaceus]
MSNITIQLRPPPNVDFVDGYPGISPAGPERPQAAVKGAIEVRVPQTGVKAKWVRVELRKVETLPPGGELNTHWDPIGPNPVNLWTSPDEYGVLRTQDFPFSIRIPESIPPSVELDSRAQITYELVASVCTKGKRGFLRKAKSVVTTSKAPITIDKHELHSTWPIYNQPEVRHVQQDGLSLMIERNHTCFGPGDRIAVNATMKSDSLHTVILRGFELALKETTVLRAGPHGARGRTQPQSRTVAVAEGKVMLNYTMYGGQQKSAEISCTLNPKHTTPTLNAARHIDVTYTLMVKAVMGTGDNLVMDLPVIISNWARDVSVNAIKQIGPVPNLSNPDSLGAAPAPAIYGVQHTGGAGRPVQASTLPVGGTSAETYGRPSTADRQNNTNMFATANPSGGVGAGVPKVPVNEFGGYSSGPSASVSARPVIAPINTGTNTARPNSRPDEIFNEGASGSRQQGGSGAQKHWPSAEEEKRLYELARTRVVDRQGPEAAPAPVQRTGTASPPTGGSSRNAATAGGSSMAGRNPQQQYPTAEDEKAALFQKAKDAVEQRNFAHNRTPSDPPMGSKPSGAQLYQQAMAARKNPPPTQAMPIQSNPAPPAFSSPSNVPAYRSAEQEKAALRRYEEARQAVDRTQSGFEDGSSSGPGPTRDSAPISYDALFGSGGAGGSSSSAAAAPPVHAPAAAPPPFDPPAGPATGAAILSEKERLRREYEARDAAALAAQRQQQEPPPPAFSAAPPSASAPPPPFTPQAPPQSQYASAIAEKEALRRKFEAQDRQRAAAAAASSLPPPAPLQTPSRNSSAAGHKPSGAGAPAYSTPPPLSPRAIPATPGGSQRILTAAEEKARLKAKYAAEEAAQRNTPPAPLQPRVNGNANGMSPSPPPFNAGTPPPLKPRPPMDYIQQTREEDARGYVNGEGGSRVGLNGNGQLDVKPFTPFNAEFDGLRSPAPPIPPKPAGE